MKRLQFLFVLIFILCVQPYMFLTNISASDANLVAYYPFNGNANDESGNENNGAVYGATLTTDKNGNSNSAYSFDGDDYIACGDLGSLPSQGTIIFWMNASEVVDYRNPFTTNFAGGNSAIRFEEHSSGLFAVAINWASAADDHEYTSSLSPNRWYHIALAWDSGGNNVRGYLDGAKVFDESQTRWPITMPDVQIGRGFDANRHWNGKIDEVRIYNRALSQPEIQTLYNGGAITSSHRVPGDYNGDRTADIALYRPASGLWAIKLVSRLYFGGSDDLPVPCDYNGDATTDIGIFRPSSGLWAIRALTRVYFGSSADIPIPGDYDGDGDCDMAIFRPGSGLWAVRGITRCYFGSSSDNPVPGDYNGDGSNIIAIFRPDSGLWAMRNLSRTYFGSDIDTSVPGDYNGDGTWEPGIFRPASGLWASRGVSRCYYGTSGDFPLAGDIDGDGTIGSTIFRPSTGLWAAPSIPRAYYGSQGDIPAFGIRNSSTARPQPPLPERKGKIIGKVTDADTGQPVMGALVSWNPYAPSAATNSSGNYELTFVDPGTHSVTVRRIGYETSTRTCVVISGGTTTLNFILVPEEVGDFAGRWVGTYSSTASRRVYYCQDRWCDLNTNGEMNMFFTQSGTEVMCKGNSGSFLSNYYWEIWWDCESSSCNYETNYTQGLSGYAEASGTNLVDGDLGHFWSFTAVRTGNTLNGRFWRDGEDWQEDSTFSLNKQ